MGEKFNKKLFVKKEFDGDEQYYIGGNTIDEIGAENGDKIAIYELKEIKKLHIDKILK